MDHPPLHTPRLTLRTLTAGDASRIHELAGQREIADTMISFPHPLSDGDARQWVAVRLETHRHGTGIPRAIVLRDSDELVGVIELRDMDAEHRQAELSLWVGVPWQGSGYATEAARAVIDDAFSRTDLNRIHAHHMVRNPGSGRVLEKAGMSREGLLRQRVIKWGRFEDVVILAIVREEWERGAAP